MASYWDDFIKSLVGKPTQPAQWGNNAVGGMTVGLNRNLNVVRPFNAHQYLTQRPPSLADLTKPQGSPAGLPVGVPTEGLQMKNGAVHGRQQPTSTGGFGEEDENQKDALRRAFSGADVQ